MKKILFAAAIVFAGYTYFTQHGATPSIAPTATEQRAADKAEARIADAFANRTSNVLVSGQGVVVKVLADDNSGSRHQRFILKLANGQTLLVAHNIDIAPRIDGLSEGDPVSFNGQYEWNAKGGVLHWTHHDPRGSHPSGWLEHRGRTYQ